MSRSARRARRHQRAFAPPYTRDWLLLGTAAVGLAVSAYLAVVDLAGASALCLTGSDCDIVRASTYSQVLGVPVTVLGVGYFLAVLTLAGSAAVWRPGVLQLLGGAGIGAALVFVGLQALVLRAWCPYCLVADAAALVVGARTLALLATARPTIPVTRSLAGAAMGVLLLVVGFAVNPMAGSGGPATAADRSLSAAGAPSVDRLAALAEHLQASGAVVYGAYWCPHCQEQKRAFGAAASQLPYVECDPRGPNAQPAACQAAGVKAYPTWVIGGQRIEGQLSPAELARRSGFAD